MNIKGICLKFVFYVLVFTIMIVMVCSMVFCFSVVYTLNTVINEDKQEQIQQYTIEDIENIISESLK